jgi:hypothetical protein
MRWLLPPEKKDPLLPLLKRHPNKETLLLQNSNVSTDVRKTKLEVITFFSEGPREK